MKKRFATPIKGAAVTLAVATIGVHLFAQNAFNKLDYRTDFCDA